MPITTKTIQDSINFCKRLSFNRNPVIGNSLEPALTAAAIVMQTILSPPFTWWWNNKEVVFTCDPTPKSATATNIAITDGVLTVTATNSFAVDDVTRGSGFTYTNLNGFAIRIETASPTQFTALVPFDDLVSVADSGVETSISTQDYTVPVPNFSHIERAQLLDLTATGAPGEWHELDVKNNLALESSQGRPNFIGPNSEDEDGNVTFRIMNSPDKKYNITVQAQLAAPPVTSINQLWSPLPDFMQYIYNWGFLALMWQFADDPRSQVANMKFVTGLLARAEGLTEEERNTFLNNWNNLTQAEQLQTQQGISARGQ